MKKKIITPEEAEKRMREISGTKFGNTALIDNEAAHGDGDDLLCEILNELGYEKAVKIFVDMDKWYA